MIRSVDRAVAILDLLAQDGRRSGAEVARGLGVHRSTALRLLGTLERHALVERDPKTSKYRLGPRLPQLARVVTGELDLRHVARPICESLAAWDQPLTSWWPLIPFLASRLMTAAMRMPSSYELPGLMASVLPSFTAPLLSWMCPCSESSGWCLAIA